MTESKENKAGANKLSRRQFLVLSGHGAVALAVLAGCAPAAAPQAPAEAPAAEGSGGEQAAPAAAPVTLEFLA